MIKLDISAAIFLYLLFNVIGVFLLWMFFDFKIKKPVLDQGKDHVWQCSICANTYIDSRNDKVSKCPQCGSYNSRKEIT